MREEKKNVKEYYDTFGWHRNANAIYNDTAIFVDRRPALCAYHYKTHMRLKNFLRSRGLYFLDAGSGAYPFTELSSGYKYHICVDFSETGLKEARCKLREKGFFILADIVRLPFKREIFDAVVSKHVLYHIPQDEQKSAVLEMLRVTKYKGSCAVIYKWPICILTKIAKLFMPSKLIWMFKNEELGKHIYPSLYCYSHNYHWFRKTFPNDWNIDIRCCQLTNYTFTKTFIPNNFFGKFLMRLIFLLEAIFPHILARICNYPIIIIHKE